MAKKTSKKKVIRTSVKKAPMGAKKTLTPTSSRNASVKYDGPVEPFLFGRLNYILLGVGALLMTIGFLLMLGGEMPDPNTWDEGIIYSFRRTVLAPFMILAGLVTLVFAIFKKQPEVN